ncbi:hypothetical protein TNCV_1191581 [Trichonephila clavipes]|nr:hypothetical protein TNCV_1191581 [Trichonephila clavipes]
MLQHQGKDPTPLICSSNPTAVSLRGRRREVYQPIERSGLTPAIHLQRSVDEKERKRYPRTPFSSLRDAAHCKLANWETNGISKK